MTILEILTLEYLSAKQEMEAYQSDEICAHKKAIEYEEKIRKIEKFLNRKVISMTKLEQLRIDYLSAKQEMEAYQSDEKCAHKKAIEYEEKMRKIEKEIKEFEKQGIEGIRKLNESVDFIKQYCREAKCDDCQFNAPYNVCNLAKPPIDW